MAKQKRNILENIVVFVIGIIGAVLGLLVSIAVPAAVVAIFTERQRRYQQAKITQQAGEAPASDAR